jgi:hypothetical protein
MKVSNKMHSVIFLQENKGGCVPSDDATCVSNRNVSNHLISSFGTLSFALGIENALPYTGLDLGRSSKVMGLPLKIPHFPWNKS